MQSFGHKKQKAAPLCRADKISIWESQRKKKKKVKEMALIVARFCFVLSLRVL